MAIRIKRSDGNTAPSSLASGQLAYVEGSTNGGTLYYGEIGGTVRAIAGKQYIDKLNGIAAGAIANVVEDTTPQLGGNLDVNGNSIVSTGNANITIAPDGTGDVILSADTVQIGDSAATATLTTNGTGNLVLNTNNGTNAGSITLSNGTNGAINITPNGSGSTIIGNGTGQLVAQLTAAVANTAPSIMMRKNRTDVARASMDGSLTAIGFQLRDNTATNWTYARISGIYHSTLANQVMNFEYGTDGTTVTTKFATMAPYKLLLGDSGNSNTQYLTTNGTKDLIIDTNGGTNAGTITLADGADGNISITPNGTGSIVLDGLNWPQADGTADYVLKTNGSGQLSWVAQTVNTNTTYAISAETVTSGANLRLTGSDSATDDVAIIGGTNVTVTRTDANTITISSADTGITDIVNDTTPQLGGALDVNGNSIVSVSNGNITLAPNGTGKVVISGDLQIDGTTTTINSTTLDVDDLNITVAKGAANAAAANGAGLTVEGPTTQATILYTSSDDSWRLNKKTYLSGIAYPSSDGTNGQFLQTNGSGVISFATIVQANGNELENIVEDTTPQLGGNLDVNGYSLVTLSNLDLTIAPNGTGDVQLQADVFVGRTNTDVQISTNGTADLIINTNNASNSGSIRIYDGVDANIAITPNGTGSIVLDGLNWPQADGTSNQVLKTNGSGQLSWVTQTAGVTAFTGLSDVPSAYTASGGYYVKVNAGATALEFAQDVDDGTF